MRTVYKNGTIYTGNGFVTDFAVENGKFCFVGETDKATADEVVDLGGKFVCAGFNDSHMHVLNLGNVLTMANLGAHTTSLKEMLDCLRTYIKETRTAGAVPVLITPLARNSWRDPTHYNDFLADFADAVLDLGKEEAVPVLDLHAYAMQLIRQEGLETAKRWFYPGDYTHKRLWCLPDGRICGRCSR